MYKILFYIRKKKIETNFAIHLNIIDPVLVRFRSHKKLINRSSTPTENSFTTQITYTYTILYTNIHSVYYTIPNIAITNNGQKNVR
jgi:hypothetical protein